MKNVENEWYAKDISKKRRIVNKLKGNSGVPLSALPYGYMKNPDDPRYWVLDPEAVIDRATWEKVQGLKSGTRRKKPTVTQERSIFSGLLKCPECGANLNFHFN